MQRGDVVVTVPARQWAAWLAEGDLAGEAWTGLASFFKVPRVPNVVEGDRVYVVAHGRLRGYAPLVRIAHEFRGEQGVYLVRADGAVAVTVPGEIPGFRGYRYRWWDRRQEIPFPDWRDP